jgi:hypothetical protein
LGVKIDFVAPQVAQLPAAEIGRRLSLGPDLLEIEFSNAFGGKLGHRASCYSSPSNSSSGEREKPLNQVALDYGPMFQL